MSPAALLEVAGLTKRFGGLFAVRDLDMAINEGEINALIGPNGAGKTTVFNLITGILQPSAGRISLNGMALEGKRPHQITRAGVARTFQNIRLFAAMTAVENVMVGVDSHRRSGVLEAIVNSRRSHREETSGLKQALELLERTGIGHLANRQSANLSYGDQRRLEIARAMATNPKVLLLDEPTAGMNPSEKAQLMDLVRQIRDEGSTILLIEHDMKVVMGISQRITVLDFGEKIAEGRPAEVQSDPRVIEAYLGREAVQHRTS